MSRSLTLSLDAPVRVDEILAAFADADYWQARLAAFDSGTATLDSLRTDTDGGVTAALTVSLFANRLPKVVTALVPGEFTMARTETWRPVGDGTARATIDVTVPGAPVSAVGKVSLVPVDSGSRLDFSTTVRVNIPLVGGQVESFIVSRLGDEIGAVQRFTNAWIVTNR
ncbi:DUF2505 domain-containing protein [Candidatus Mycobacterium wuenschmannii]|uniref:DUF2505 domain-containing protein n=1 Tax=Candidatus Mycobacterium wuenschmannii TaxID=3027808 RepID=A0ABY8VZX8_9MYCO|nr:DUF2505 domain-containing protein [Candidatus Mycobacterium wuenschmannii]WIM89158.1 DUF2505 domain-containing protein [Candidatus Mycobacterium wuenschmannii]